jgi:hypothetical protein
LYDTEDMARAALEELLRYIEMHKLKTEMPPSL